MFSSVTGSLIQPQKLGPKYWVDNLTSPVNFTGALRALLNYSKGQKRVIDRTAFASVFLEVGPHSALIQLSSRYLQDGRKIYEFVLCQCPEKRP
jgi:acyl transferase domain-containing protein